MCGIAGLIDWQARMGPDATRRAVEAMTARLVHRGPDADGLWQDTGGVATLGHRRLSIIDLSETGAQPMVSADGDLVITYNGELYNYRDIADDLRAEGVALRGTSDTEVLLEAISLWGLKAALERSVGMFAFALWSRSRRELVLARDRLGKKPLYWSAHGDRLSFASELTALLTLDSTPRDIDRDALTLYMRHACVPAPRTILAGVNKLMPGHTMTFRDGKQHSGCYWDLRAIARQGARQPLDVTPDEAVGTLDGLVGDAVAKRMIADVPLGAFLSGGIDSSLMVATMQARSSAPIKTFTIAFDEEGWDEGGYARDVAERLGTDHRELRLAPDTGLAMVDDVAAFYDEPFADASQLATWLVSRLAREDVIVALSGDGGDELFAGYSRYGWATAAHRRFQRVPQGARRAAAALLADAPLPGIWGDRLRHHAGMADAGDTDELYRRLVSAWREPSGVVADASEPTGVLWDRTLTGDVPDPIARMQLLDAMTFLPDDILTKLDRASMAVSLEARTPLLDHRIAEFAFALPRHVMRLDGEGKWPLRQLLYRHLPKELFDRPKRGFSVPVGTWLRGPLKSWAERLIDRRRLNEAGLLNARAVEGAWRRHQAGRSGWANALWAVLMFEAWRDSHGFA